jgi:hypothetical protein
MATFAQLAKPVIAGADGMCVGCLVYLREAFQGAKSKCGELAQPRRQILRFYRMNQTDVAL